IRVVAADRAARLAEERLLQGTGLGVEDGKVDARVARFDADTTHDAAPDADTGPERTCRLPARVPRVAPRPTGTGRCPAGCDPAGVFRPGHPDRRPRAPAEVHPAA